MFSGILVLVLVLFLYWYATRNFNYWKKKGVKHDPPLPFVGNNLPGVLMQKNIPKVYEDLCKKYSTEKVVGFYRSSKPELVLQDPELIKRVLQTDFNCFYRRGLLPKHFDEPLLKNLFNVEGDLWRLLRHRMTPAFTTAKLKAMFPLIVERAEQLQTRLAAQHDQTVDARDLMARFTTDFIGACGFGIDSKSLDTEDSINKWFCFCRVSPGADAVACGAGGGAVSVLRGARADLGPAPRAEWQAFCCTDD